MATTQQPWGMTPGVGPAERRRRRVGLLIGGLVLATLIVVGGLLARRTTFTGDTATEACHVQVKRNLKAPSTASFVGDDSTFGSKTVIVEGSVDAENGFGAKIRNRYQCTVTEAGGGNVDVVVNSISPG